MLIAYEEPGTETIRAPVLKVFDGDGFKTMLWNTQLNKACEVVVRLGFTDAPELEQPGGKESKEFLTSLIADRWVELRRPRGPACRPGFRIDECQQPSDGLGRGKWILERGGYGVAVEQSVLRELSFQQHSDNEAAIMVDQSGAKAVKMTLGTAFQQDLGQSVAKGGAGNRPVAAALAPMPGRDREAAFNDGLGEQGRQDRRKFGPSVTLEIIVNAEHVSNML